MGDGLWFLEGLSDGDWPEDFDHENGCYTCKCCLCESEFMGHKRQDLLLVFFRYPKKN